MKKLVGVMVIVLCVAMGASVAFATTSTIDISTGVGLTTAGEEDANWTVGGGFYSDWSERTTVAAAQLLTSSAANWYSSWEANSSSSAWIGVTADNTGNGYLYSYQISFDLSDYDLSTVSISGKWAVDDAGVLMVNGRAIAYLDSAYSLQSFSLAVGSAYLNEGINTITILMTSTDNYLEGARLEGEVSGTLKTSVVPVPGAVWLFGSGLISLIGLRRKRNA
ncbi:MAG: PEP-CTERM sorting domain-containing protein [Syntrophobacteraceae bacterium]